MNTDQMARKIYNQISLLRLIRREGQASQSVLSSLTGLQPSTVSNLIRDLKDLGLIEITGKGVSGPGGGKRSDLLSLSGKRGVFSGMEIRTSGIGAALIDFSGTVLKTEEIRFPVKDENALFRQLKRIIGRETEEWKAGYLGIGVAVPSVVSNGGDIFPSIDFDWEIPDFKNKFLELVPAGCIPALENDANCAALYAQHFFRSAYANFITLLVHPDRGSTGSGIILDGKLFRGSHGAAGELIRLDATDVFSVENVARHASYAATLLDCEAIVLSGEMETGSGRHYFQDIMTLIRTMNDKVALGVIPDMNIAVTGAAFLAAGVFIETLLKEKGGIS